MQRVQNEQLTIIAVGALGLAVTSGASAQLDITHEYAHGVNALQSGNDEVAAVSVDFESGVHSAINIDDGSRLTAGVRHTTAPMTSTEVLFHPDLGNPLSRSIANDVIAIDPAISRISGCDQTDANWAVVTGSYIGDVNFQLPLGHFPFAATGNRLAAYAIRVSPGNVLAAAQLEPLTSDPNSAVEIISVAAGPPCVACGGASASSSSGPLAPGALGAGASGPTGPLPPKSDPYVCDPGNGGLVALAGYFAGDVNFDPLLFQGPVESADAEDAFVSLRHLETLFPNSNGSLPIELHLSSPGNERITAIDMSEHTSRIAVTGYFTDHDSHALLDFDPHSTAMPPRTVNAPLQAHDDEDIFVAVYDFNSQGRYELRWLYTIDNPGVDSGTGVAFDSADNVFVTGWLANGSNGREIWMARINDFATAPTSGLAAPDWEYVFGDYGDDIGLDVTVDHLDRPVFAGHFGDPVGDDPQYCIDVDGGAGASWLCAEGRLDGYVVRYYPNGALEWGFNVGGAAYDDRVSGVDANRRYVGRLAYGGAFGEPNAPMGYQVDFNPHSSTTNLLATQGGADGFVCVSDPILPAEARAEVAIVLDMNSLVDPANWKSLVAAASLKIRTGNIMPWDGQTVITVLATGSDEYGDTSTSGPLIPWTAVDHKTSQLFAQRLANTSQPRPGDSSNSLGRGVAEAADQIDGNTVTQGYRNMLLIASFENADANMIPGETLLQNARDAALDEPTHAQAKLDQINMFVVHETAFSIDRTYALSHAIDSIEDVPGNPPLEANLGFAAYLSPLQTGYQDPQLAPALGRMLQRMSYCNGDYNLSLGVDSQDDFAFNAGFGFDPYADWNFDGSWDTFDENKFDVDFNLGIVSCPP